MMPFAALTGYGICAAFFGFLILQAIEKDKDYELDIGALVTITLAIASIGATVGGWICLQIAYFLAPAHKTRASIAMIFVLWLMGVLCIAGIFIVDGFYCEHLVFTFWVLTFSLFGAAVSLVRNDLKQRRL